MECGQLPLFEPFHETVIEVTAKADIAEIILILKVLGNAGHPASIKYITKFLPIFRNQIPLFPMRVQVGAVLALKAIAKKEPKLVSQIFFSHALLCHTDCELLQLLFLCSSPWDPPPSLTKQQIDELNHVF